MGTNLEDVGPLLFGRTKVLEKQHEKRGRSCIESVGKYIGWVASLYSDDLFSSLNMRRAIEL